MVASSFDRFTGRSFKLMLQSWVTCRPCSIDRQKKSGIANLGFEELPAEVRKILLSPIGLILWFGVARDTQLTMGSVLRRLFGPIRYFPFCTVDVVIFSSAAPFLCQNCCHGRVGCVPALPVLQAHVLRIQGDSRESRPPLGANGRFPCAVDLQEEILENSSAHPTKASRC